MRAPESGGPRLRLVSLVSLVLLALLVLPATLMAEGLPRVEFGIGGGFTSYQIGCDYSGPNLYYEDFPIRTYESFLLLTGDDPDSAPVAYPFEEGVAAIHTDFLVRWPLGGNMAVAYSNRVNFAFADRIHRGDYVNSYGPILTIFGLTGAEFEFYFLPGFEGPWISGLGGIAVLDQPFADGYFTQIGLAGGATLGWRFSPKGAIALDALYHWTNVAPWVMDAVMEAGADIEGSSTGLSLSLAYRYGF